MNYKNILKIYTEKVNINHIEVKKKDRKCKKKSSLYKITDSL